MKKIKMDAAKLQLKKEKIAGLNKDEQGKVGGGGPIYSLTYCAYVCVKSMGNVPNEPPCIINPDQSVTCGTGPMIG